jgi:hypothetical protein
VDAAQAFGVTPRAIANARNDESPQREFIDLSLPPKNRDKLVNQRLLLNKYFNQIEPVSGMFFVLPTVFLHFLFLCDIYLIRRSN